jgi:hypothetical protein
LIWDNLGLRPLHYRVLWWMVDMGAMQGAFLRGWQQICAEDLGIHRITLRRATKVLISKGVLQEYRRGTVGFVADAFESEADPERVKIVKEAIPCAASR